MSEIRNLFRAFSEFKGFDGWLIAKLHFFYIEKEWYDWKENQQEEILTEIVKQGKQYFIGNVIRNKICIQMYLLKPQTLSKREDSLTQFFLPKTCRKLAVRVFLKEEIQEFTKDIKDRNQIHQGEQPIVPGLMMVEWLFNQKISLWNQEIIFHAPAYAQQEIIIYQNQQHYFAVTKKQKQRRDYRYLLWEMKSI